MASENVIPFLSTVAIRPDVLERLKVRPKSEVVTAAAEFGYPFTEDEFNSLIWRLEEQLAERRQETFAPRFRLWETMWGVYYLEYLVTDLIPGLESIGLLPRSR